MPSQALQPLSCRQLVELVTEYLEGTLSGLDQARFEEHIALCPMCQVHLEQLRLTVRELGRLGEQDIDPEILAELRERFRDWNADG